MFFILSKIIGLLINPLSWLIIGLLIVVFSRKPVLKKITIIALLIALIVFTNPLVTDLVAKSWEPSPVAVEMLPSYDIGIVLGGFSRYFSGSGNMELADAGDRLWQTVMMYKKGKIRYILISGGSTTTAKPESETVYDALIAMGVPDSVLLFENKSRNTRENAVFSTELIAAGHPGSTCILITSAWHMKRSLGCFRKAGLYPDAFPSDHISRYDKMYCTKWIRPDPEALRYWDLLFNEWVGIVAYKIQGYM